MKRFTVKYKKISITFIGASFLICLIMVTVFPWLSGIYKNKKANNYYEATINGETVGASDSREKLETSLEQARAKLNKETGQLLYLDADIEINEYDRIIGKYDSESKMVDKMYKMLKNQSNSKCDKAYIVDIDGYTVTLQSLDDVKKLLESAESKYDISGEFSTCLTESNLSGFRTITCNINKADVVAKDTNTVTSTNQMNEISFLQEIEIVPSYVDGTQISGLDTAINEMNSDNTSLSVIVNRRETYEQEYSLETQYIYNENMYNNQQNVLQEGKPGIKKVVADVCYNNGVEASRDIKDEEVLVDAIPTVIEVGVVQPPSFIRPLSGGYVSSYFGFRWGSFHKGVDFACNTGTSVKASSDGQVTIAGWVNGYGNCVMIQHSDGKSTRYGHLSQILVNVGDNVSQGQEIALSGNTGDSTGPHLHFEVLVNGVPVNPMDIIQ